MKSTFNGDPSVYSRLVSALYHSIKRVSDKDQKALYGYSYILLKLMLPVNETPFESIITELDEWIRLKSKGDVELSKDYERHIPVKYPIFFKSGYEPWEFGHTRGFDDTDEVGELHYVSSQQIALLCSMFHELNAVLNDGDETLSSYLDLIHKLMRPNNQTEFEEFAMELYRLAWYKAELEDELITQQRQFIIVKYRRWFDLWSRPKGAIIPKPA